jgi:peptide/nickel transport system substrate-binding protein
MAISGTRRSVVLALMALVACLAAPRGPGAVELRIGLAVGPTTMDPHFHADAANFAVHRHVFEALLQWSPDGRLLPMLARAWAPLPDGDGWALHIDPAAHFADGTPVTAMDAAASLRRAMTIPNSPGRYTPFLSGLRHAEAVAPDLLHLRGDGPLPLLPNGLTTIMIVPESIAGRAVPGDFAIGRDGHGSGPFLLGRWRPSEATSLRRNPAWWQAGRRAGSPWESVTLRVMPPDSTRVAALLAGDVDLIEGVPPRDLARIAATPRLRVARQDGTRVMYLALNQGATREDGQRPLADPRIRRALSLAIDRVALAAQVMDGTAQPAARLVPPGRPGGDAEAVPLPADRTEARRLLREARGEGALTLTLTGTTNRFPQDETLLQALAQMWRQAGIAVEVEALPAAVFLPRYVGGRYDVALFGWLTGPGEPNAVFGAVLGSRDAALGRGALNATGYGNPRVDALIAAGLSNRDPAGRHEAWRDAAQIALGDDAALVPLLHLASLWAMRAGIAYTPRMDGLTLAQGAVQAASR